MKGGNKFIYQSNIWLEELRSIKNCKIQVTICELRCHILSEYLNQNMQGNNYEDV